MANNSKYSYTSETIRQGENNTDVLAQDYVTDELMHSRGIYSKSDIKDAKFNKYSRFGRILDPYGRVNGGREYLFFVKPDLHIVVPYGKSTSDTLYTMGGFQKTNTIAGNGYRLNPQLANNSYFVGLLNTNPEIIPEIQKSATASVDPFSHLLSFSVNSALPLDSSNSQTMDNPATIYGTAYKYLQDSEASDENYSFSLEFVDDKSLSTYQFFKAYSEYHIARKSGLVTPPSLDYYKYKRLHNTMGIYKFIVDEDMETLIYWAYLWGVYPTSCPRDAFQDASFSDGLTFSVSFDAAFIEDMTPAILSQFNYLMMKVLNKNGINKNDWLPVVKHNRKSDMLYGRNHGYDASLSLGASEQSFSGMKYNIGATEWIDGTLPCAALVDGRILETDSRSKYRLRWYAKK